jgi:hypothetical protein
MIYNYFALNCHVYIYLLYHITIMSVYINSFFCQGICRRFCTSCSSYLHESNKIRLKLHFKSQIMAKISFLPMLSHLSIFLC